VGVIELVMIELAVIELGAMPLSEACLIDIVLN
jgi:hypothetical protein